MQMHIRIQFENTELLMDSASSISANTGTFVWWSQFNKLYACKSVLTFDSLKSTRISGPISMRQALKVSCIRLRSAIVMVNYNIMDMVIKGNCAPLPNALAKPIKDHICWTPAKTIIILKGMINCTRQRSRERQARFGDDKEQNSRTCSDQFMWLLVAFGRCSFIAGTSLLETIHA